MATLTQNTNPIKSLTADNYSSGGSVGKDLGAFMKSTYDPYAQTIMQQYDATKSATSAGAQSVNKSITDTGNFNIGYQSEMDKAQGTQMLEGGRGFAVNPGAIKILSDTSTKRIRDLTTQMNDALANNNTALASRLADLSVAENTALTNARTTFLNQYFGVQNEARAQAGEQRARASFQTPEQQSVMTLSTQYPDAGVQPTDSLAAATAKVQQSALFRNNVDKGRADIANALAQAAAAPIQAGAAATSAQATKIQATAQAALAGVQVQQRQKILNSLNDPTAFTGDVNGLLSGTMTMDTLSNKYKDYPEGTGGLIIANILSQAQAKGFSPTQSELNYLGQKASTQGWAGGNLFTMFGTALSGAGSAAANKTLSNPTTSTGTTPSGLGYTIH